MTPYELHETTNYASDLRRCGGSSFVRLRTHEVTDRTFAQVRGVTSFVRPLRRDYSLVAPALTTNTPTEEITRAVVRLW